MKSPPLKAVKKELPFEGGGLRIVAVADTHGRPHSALGARLAELAPGHILHAGDVGGPDVLRALERYAPVTAVRGNIDPRELPDAVAIALRPDGADVAGARGWPTILLTHVAVAGLGIRADIARLARAEGATVVVCGHSHVPFAGEDKGVFVFNPGSVGPRRFHLPIVLGVLDLAEGGFRVRHVSCETGLPWTPGA